MASWPRRPRWPRLPASRMASGEGRWRPTGCRTPTTAATAEEEAMALARAEDEPALLVPNIAVLARSPPSPASPWRPSCIWAAAAAPAEAVATLMSRPGALPTVAGQFFFDRIYRALVVQPLEWLAAVWAWLDLHAMDGLVDLHRRVARAVGRRAAAAAERHGPVLCVGHGPGTAGLDRERSVVMNNAGTGPFFGQSTPTYTNDVIR